MKRQERKSRAIQPVVRIVPLKKQPTDFAYWQTRPYAERLAAVEEIRREYHGWKTNSRPRLARVYRIVKCETTGHIKKNKRRVGRAQDIADLEKLKKG